MHINRAHLALLMVAFGAYFLTTPPSSVAAESCDNKVLNLEGPCPFGDPYFDCYAMFPECGMPTDGECYDYNGGPNHGMFHDLVCLYNW